MILTMTHGARSYTCLEHKSYDIAASKTAIPINVAAPAERHEYSQSSVRGQSSNWYDDDDDDVNGVMHVYMYVCF